MDLRTNLFADWSRLGVLVIATVAAYAALLGTLRVTGKRTLSKLNAFDFVVTIAFGSVLATTALSRDVPIIEGIVALVLLALLQLMVARVTSRREAVRRVVTASPRALLVDGRVREGVLLQERLTLDELAQAVRAEGYGSLRDLDYVILETDGSFSVIRSAGDRSAMVGVVGVGHDAVATARRTGTLQGSAEHDHER